MRGHMARQKAYIADTLALVVFFTTTGILKERFVAGMAREQVLQARTHHRRAINGAGRTVLWHVARLDDGPRTPSRCCGTACL